jgi:hypothetical protein
LIVSGGSPFIFLATSSALTAGIAVIDIPAAESKLDFKKFLRFMAKSIPPANQLALTAGTGSSLSIAVHHNLGLFDVADKSYRIATLSPQLYISTLVTW